MSRSNFPSRVHHVQPNSPVSASNTSRPTRELENRTNFLREELNTINAGRMLRLDEQTLDPSLLEGQAVFWNDDTQRFEAAIAAVENDPVSGTFKMSRTSNCLGVVLKKTAANLGTIVTVGAATFSAEQLANMIDGELTPGWYFLSGVNPGRLVAQQPPVTIPVLYLIGVAGDCETDQTVLVIPQQKDLLSQHVHYRFDLVCRPAGTVDAAEALSTGHHVITDGDSTERGWLPADDPSFDGRAPAGACFGYNLAAHGELSRVWPPVPLEAAIVLWDRGEGLLGATEINSRGSDPLRLVTIDRYGIWWMTDCYGDVPWPTDLTSIESSSSSAGAATSQSSETAEVCPRPERMRLILGFLHMLFTTDRTVVTSLQPDTGQPIEFVNCDGVAAKTGDLRARLTVAAMIDPNEAFGGQVLKTIINGKLLFGAGWVAEGLYALSERLHLTGPHRRRLIPGDNDSPWLYQGAVGVDVNLSPSERELDPQITRLGDAVEREFEKVFYIAFPQNRDSGIRMRIDVPSAGLPASPQVKIRVRLFVRGAAGPMPELTLSYYRVVAPTEGSPTLLGEGDTPLTFDVVTPSTGLAADSVIIVESDAFTVAAGDTLFVELNRASDAVPTLNAEVGMLRASGVILPGV